MSPALHGPVPCEDTTTALVHLRYAEGPALERQPARMVCGKAVPCAHDQPHKRTRDVRCQACLDALERRRSR